MTLTRRHFSSGLIAVLGAAALPTWARALVEGRDWRPVPAPRPSDTPGKIEVLEFFHYGCPHCSRFNPLVEQWAESLPEDVAFQRMPVTWGRSALENLARLYFTIEYTDNKARLDQAVFDALHERPKQRLFSEKDIFDWVADQGIDRKSFEEVFGSFAVETRLARSKQIEKDYEINAVPMVIVGGRYIVVGEKASTYQDLLEIAEALIDKVRKEGAV